MKKKPPKESFTLYLCGVDYQHELGECETRVFASIEGLKNMQPCWKSCGIVEIKIKVEGVRWIKKQNLRLGVKKDKRDIFRKV